MCHCVDSIWYITTRRHLQLPSQQRRPTKTTKSSPDIYRNFNQFFYHLDHFEFIMTSTLCNSKSLLAVFLIAVLLPLALAQEIESATESSAAAPADGPFDFTGRFRLYSSKNFDEFLKELGIGYFQRLAANNAVPEYFITKKGDYYTLRAITPLSDNSITFKDGEEFKEDRLDGVRLRSIITIDGHKWTQIQYGKPEVTIVREWVGNDIITTSTANNVVSVRKYRRVRSAPAKPRTAIGRAASRAAGRT